MKKAAAFFVFVFFQLLGMFLYAQEVAIVVSDDYKIYSLAIDGFNEACNATAKEYRMHGSQEKGREIVKEIQSQSPQLIFVLGNKAAQIAKLEITDIPIIFGMVINPIRYGLAGQNVCGVRLDVSPLEQFKMLKKVMPLVKTIGVIYNPANSKNIIKEAKKAAKAEGMDIIAVAASSPADVSEGIVSLEGMVDSFWIILDPVSASTIVFKRLVLFSMKNRIPLLCPSRAFVKKGGLLSLEADYRGVGEQAGTLAGQILDGVETPGTIGIKFPAKLAFIVNLKTAEKMGVDIPEIILEKAVEVYK